MPSIKAVLFDLDDTLWPVVPVIERAENLMFDWLRRHAPAVPARFSITELRERRKALMATDPVYQLDLRRLRHAGLTEAFLATGEDPALVESAMAVFTKARNEVELFDDVLPALSALRGRVILGSVSNGVADLEAIGLAHWFDASIAAYQLGRAKPDPEIFLAACDALGVAPRETVYVGDDPRLDVEGAQRAGLRGVLMDRQHLRPRDIPAHIAPDAVCGTLTELQQWLQDELAKP
ncbi:HAD family hydrolase [Noviherbaspirillum galbum]|uniref:HAD family hydrolase n=1 Tax=Noviherbaspirillum galbum TaxID=2709383 RepID=A0A6B3SQN4_9BURK|nr:HAD family hydrolase [Noviherbaspirillum galbum]NEX60722.1 HAD family hydrolase [Noviherbaspirillum galbum]